MLRLLSKHSSELSCYGGGSQGATVRGVTMSVGAVATARAYFQLMSLTSKPQGVKRCDCATVTAFVWTSTVGKGEIGTK